MAAGNFIIYTSAVKHIMQGNISLNSDTIVAIPLHSGYTPSTGSHSALAQIVGDQCTASGSVVGTIALSSVNITGSGAAQITFDAADLAGFSAGGDTFQCKYVALYAQSASAAGSDNLLLGFMDVETGASTGLEGTQLNVTWPAGGIFEVRVNQTT